MLKSMEKLRIAFRFQIKILNLHIENTNLNLYWYEEIIFNRFISVNFSIEFRSIAICYS